MESRDSIPTDLQLKESKEVSRFPVIRFQVSNAGENSPYNDDLVRIQSELEPRWRGVEQGVLTSFEEVTGGFWDDFSRANGMTVTLTAIDGSKTHPHKYLQLGCREVKSRWAKEQGLMGSMRNTTSLLGSLVHELGHNFMSREDVELMIRTFGSRYDKDKTALNPKGFFNEVYAELVSHAVSERNFSEDETTLWKQRQRLGHKGVYDFLDSLSEDEKQMIINRQHSARIATTSADQITTTNKLVDIRSRLARIFTKR